MTSSETQGQSSIGLRYMAEASFYFSVMSALVKVAGTRGVPWEQIVFARAFFAMLMTFAWLRMRHVRPWGNSKPWLVGRGLLGVGGLMCFYYAITHLPLGDATVIQFTNPAFVAIFAVFLLGEGLRVRDLAATFVCLAGVALIAQPSFLFGGGGRLPLFGVGVALLGAVISAMAYTVVRRLGRSEHPLVIVLWFPMVATPLTLPLALLAGYVPDLVDVAVLFGVGLSSQLAQVRMTQGLKLERAARATAITYLQVVFAFIWGLLLFSEVPTLLTVVGTVVIIATTFAVSASKTRGAAGAEKESEPKG